METKTKNKNDYFFVGQKVIIAKKLDSSKILYNFDDVDKKDVAKIITETNKEIEKGLSGTVISIDENYLTLNLNKEYVFTSGIYPLSSLIPDRKTYFVVNKKNCIYNKQDSRISKKKIACIGFISNTDNTTIENKCNRALSIKKNCEYDSKLIKEYKEKINQIMGRKQEDLMLLSKEIINVKSFLDKKGVQLNNYLDYYNNIFKNKSVKDVKVVNYEGTDCLMLTTNELTYQDSVEHKNTVFGKVIKDHSFNIGAYKVIFFKDGSATAVNYTRFIGSGEHHPCISDRGRICMGLHYEAVLSEAIHSGDYASAIHLTIDFLKNPNSTNPYTDSTNFILNQERKFKPKDDLMLFTKSSCYNETWNTNKYKEDLEKYKDIFSKCEDSEIIEEDYDEDSDADQL